MTDWNKIKCYQCGKCNKKGLPSVMKGSKICEERRGILAPERVSAWTNFKFGIQNFFAQKGFMRRSGTPKKPKEKEDEKDEQNQDVV